MVAEVVAALGCRPDTSAVYLDGTVGLGGHTEAILKQTAPNGRVIGCDRDEAALSRAAVNLAAFGDRVTLRKAAFSELPAVFEALPQMEIAGALFDLGVSSLQLDEPTRGFSFRYPGPLDMRMDQSEGETAADWLHRQSADEIAETLREYGDERWAGRIARAVVRHRTEVGAITRCEALEQVIWRSVPPAARHGRIHPATRTFQAIRMAVNREVDQLAAGLTAAAALLGLGGRLVVISFHSVEDRCVKQTFRHWEREAVGDRQFVLPCKKPIQPGEAEVARNPRARSAKMRILERAA